MALAGGRLAIGAGLWLAPARSLRTLGFGAPGTAAVTLARVAATRDLVLGAWQLHALDDRDQLRRASTAVAVTDGGDSIAFGLALLAGDEARGAGARGVAAAAPAALAGAWLVHRLRP